MASTIVAGPDRAWIPTHSQDLSPKSTTVISKENVTLPEGFPKAIESPTAWTAADIEKGHGSELYTLTLSKEDVAELEHACNEFQDLFLPFEKLTKDLFPLPTLGNKLKSLAAQLTGGVGFFHIRGLDPQRYTHHANVVIYLGISSYIADKRGRQDEHGNMLLHLTDLGSEVKVGDERQPPYSNVGQPFHTDIGDIIGLYSLGEAENGGESQLASAATVYNELAKTRPDIIKLLASSSWAFDSFGQSPSYTERPILFAQAEDKVLFSFSRRPLVGNISSPRSRDIPELSAEQVEAINAVHFACERNALSMKLKAGELLFWNNIRHLLRLWLRNDATEKNWPIPAEVEGPWNNAFNHAGRSQLWPVEPIRDREYIIIQTRTSGHA